MRDNLQCLNKKDKIIIILIMIVSITISVFLIFKIIKTLKYPQGNPNDISYTNTTNDNVNYLVYLKDNNYLNQEYLDSRFSYLTNLVEYIKTEFSYEYNMDNYNSVNYTYQITTNINARSSDETNKTTNPLWQRGEIILKPITKNNVSLPIKINEQLNISIVPYNQLVENFKQTFNIPIDCHLEVNLIISINGKTNKGEDFVKQHIVTINIPLGVKTFDITTAKNFTEKEIVYNKEQPKKETSYMWAIIYIGLLFGTAGGCIYIIKLIIDKNYSKYSLEKKRILKEYDDRIVQVSRFIKYDNWEIVDVKTFTELLDLSNEAFEPIFFWERRINHNKEAWFSILRDKVLYRYIIHLYLTDKESNK